MKLEKREKKRTITNFFHQENIQKCNSIVRSLNHWCTWSTRKLRDRFLFLFHVCLWFPKKISFFFYKKQGIQLEIVNLSTISSIKNNFVSFFCLQRNQINCRLNRWGHFFIGKRKLLISLELSKVLAAFHFQQNPCKQIKNDAETNYIVRVTKLHR